MMDRDVAILFVSFGAFILFLFGSGITACRDSRNEEFPRDLIFNEVGEQKQRAGGKTFTDMVFLRYVGRTNESLVFGTVSGRFIIPNNVGASFTIGNDFMGTVIDLNPVTIRVSRRES